MKKKEIYLRLQLSPFPVLVKLQTYNKFVHIFSHCKFNRSFQSHDFTWKKRAEQKMVRIVVTQKTRKKLKRMWEKLHSTNLFGNEWFSYGRRSDKEIYFKIMWKTVKSGKCVGHQQYGNGEISCFKGDIWLDCCNQMVASTRKLVKWVSLRVFCWYK